MSLFIRVQTSFWTHRKTLRLRTRIGDAALWLPPRLWSYAAENQPDGDFAKYSAEEMAMLLGCSTDAQAMLQALQDTGFMDGMKIHDWKEHNGYHETYSKRAKKAAEARWKGQDRTGQDKKGEEKRQAMLNSTSSNATSITTEKKEETDEEWIAGLEKSEAYRGINVRVQLAKARQWCIPNRRQCTRRFFVNWLNRAHADDRTIATNGTQMLPKLPGHR